MTGHLQGLSCHSSLSYTAAMGRGPPRCWAFGSSGSGGREKESGSRRVLLLQPHSPPSDPGLFTTGCTAWSRVRVLPLAGTLPALTGVWPASLFSLPQEGYSVAQMSQSWV